MNARRMTSFSSGFLQCFVFLVLISGLSEAAVFNCNSGDVSCLINAIEDANDELNNPGSDTINLDGSAFILVSVNNHTDGSNGLPSVGSTIIINGNGATIERSAGAPEFRILHISNPYGNLSLNNLVIKGGFSSAEDAGGGILDGGGGILNAGMLTINESIVSNNRTADGGPGPVMSPNTGGAGGGIANSSTGDLTINNSTIADNSTGKGATNTVNPVNGDGGLGGPGGGISNIGILKITNSAVSGNSTGDGGKGSIEGGNGGNGGGIWNDGTMMMANTTVSGNSTGNGGEGLDGNGGDGGDGGGISAGFDINGSTDIVHSTITQNSIGIGGPGFTAHGNQGDGSGLAATFGTVNISGSIVVHKLFAGITHNCIGTITNGGSNLSNDASCGFGAGDSNSNINLNPILADNGGSTQTHALLADSDAIDMGDNVICSGDPVNGVDQRNFPRDADCDIGAYELVSTGTLEITKETNPTGGIGFEFVGTNIPTGCILDDFTLNDGGGEACVLAVGTYTVQEVNLPAGWAVTAIDCIGSSSFSVNADTLTIDLAAGENVSCIFTNEQPSQAVGSLMEEVEALELPDGIDNSLLKKLDNTLKSLVNGNNNAVMNQLGAFINQVEDLNQAGYVDDDDAILLIAIAQAIINSL